MSRVTSTYIETVHSSIANRSVFLTAIESLINGCLDTVAQTKAGSVKSFAKSTILSYFELIKYGVLTVESDGSLLEFGEYYVLESDGFSRELKASIKVLDESFWIRLFMHPDFGFADAYMLKLIEVDNLSSIFKMFILNRKILGEMKSYLAPLLHRISYFSNLRFANTLLGSKSNISVHYDLPQELFTGFLSWDLTYSCAVFDKEAGGHIGDLKEARPIAPPRNLADPDFRSIPPDDLERGQMAKLHLIAKKARIGKGSRVLDIGYELLRLNRGTYLPSVLPRIAEGGEALPSWSAFGLSHAAKEYGAIVDTLTISEAQKTAADALIAAQGLSEQITVHLMDYRDMPAHFKNAFDAVISIGVTEHIGFEFLGLWFKKIAWAMKPQNSFKVFTMSTVPDTRWKQFRSGAALSSPKTLVNAITDAGLNIVSIDDLSPHYTRTAREWGYRFARNFDTHIKPALQKHDRHITDEGLEIFRRKWTYYFAYCEGGFALRCIYDQLFVTSPEHNVLGYSD
ncbi:hypothetical protein C0995_013483 [Termitomyces sp. Mi166|nr:hypothetical protein C0995_013483 [Termitomyces sp. Mi166\